jgi:hypothetical protein
MKRPLKLADKIIVYFRWMSVSKKYALISSCSICQSTKINRVHANGDFKEGNSIVYTAKYECMDCHASADVKEVWSK